MNRRTALVGLGGVLGSLGWLAPGAWAAAAGAGPDLRFLTNPSDPILHLRGDFHNCRIRFERAKRGRVVFMGGSITEMNGHRPLVERFLQQRFPTTRFTFVNAGIASTGSTTGSFRLAQDVLRGDPVDLLFLEFAVNDDQDEHLSETACLRAMEGIVRHLRESSPQTDVVLTYFVNPGMLRTIEAGKTPLPIRCHEKVARYYGVSTVDLAREVALQIQSGQLTWQAYGGTHPGPRGNGLAAGLIERLLTRAWLKPLPGDTVAEAHRIPVRPLDRACFARGHWVEVKQAVWKQGWWIGVPDWKKLPGAKRDRFTAIPLLCGREPGATLTLAFRGTAVGAFVLAGPDAGEVEVSVDGAPFRTVNLYHHFSQGLHYPRTVMFAEGLAPGDHRLRLRIAAATKSQGHAVRIMEFAVN